MRYIKTLTFVFVALSLGIAYYLFHSLRSEIVAQEQIDHLEELVIDRLKMIRKAQRAHRDSRGSYANHWDSLVRFIEKDMLYITTRKEKVITLDYGADSVKIIVDTLGFVSVRDSLFSPSEYPNFEPRQIAQLPHLDTRMFGLFTDQIERSGVIVDVIEVIDTVPVNSKRSAKSKDRSLQPLHFGSRTTVSLAGNWE